VFATTYDQNYHFRSGGFKTITFSNKEIKKWKKYYLLVQF
jgi:hypothetical protein